MFKHLKKAFAIYDYPSLSVVEAFFLECVAIATLYIPYRIVIWLINLLPSPQHHDLVLYYVVHALKVILAAGTIGKACVVTVNYIRKCIIVCKFKNEKLKLKLSREIEEEFKTCQITISDYDESKTIQNDNLKMTPIDS